MERHISHLIQLLSLCAHALSAPLQTLYCGSVIVHNTTNAPRSATAACVHQEYNGVASKLAIYSKGSMLRNFLMAPLDSASKIGQDTMFHQCIITAIDYQMNSCASGCWVMSAEGEEMSGCGLWEKKRGVQNFATELTPFKRDFVRREDFIEF